MKRLFLASQIDESIDKFVQLLGKKPEETTLVFVPTAGNYKNKPLEERSEWQCVLQRGFKAFPFDVEGSTEQAAQEAFSKADVLLMAGGNTFALLDQLRKTGADKAVQDFVRAGKWYVGSSAGSIICAPDISYIAPMDSPQLAPDLKNYKGLALTTVAIVPHAGGSPHGPIPPAIKEKLGADNDLLELADEQALVEEGSDRRII